jgi:uncharacterized PurR-regulated membrane protein YhhQ (DUF165 family)
MALMADAARIRTLAVPVGLMAAVVLASNILVQYPFTPWGLQDYLTWGAFSYPIAFLVTDLTNRTLGPRVARRVIYVGFILAVILSALFGTPRIALASGLAFLCAQLLDVEIFVRLRRLAWWVPPFVSPLISSALDTTLFFCVAFSCAPLITLALGTLGIHDACGADLPWQSWAVCDYLVKLVLAVVFLAPYRVFMAWLVPAWNAPVSQQG